MHFCADRGFGGKLVSTGSNDAGQCRQHHGVRALRAEDPLLRSNTHLYKRKKSFERIKKSELFCAPPVFLMYEVQKYSLHVVRVRI